jgi:hypothetical protein
MVVELGISPGTAGLVLPRLIPWLRRRSAFSRQAAAESFARKLTEESISTEIIFLCAAARIR